MDFKSKSTPLITYIHEISGQLRRQNIIESDHSYAKFWNRHPDPSNKSRPARFLFMVRWSNSKVESDIIDVDDNFSSSPTINPLVAEVTTLTKGQVSITEEFAVTDSAPNKLNWSNLAQRIWAKALNILYTDRLIRMSIESTSNEIITKKMVSHKCANKFRHLFASLAFWDPSILSWLHATLLEHVSGQYLIAYHESMQLLRSKFPTLVDRFYLPPVHNDPIRSRNKGTMPDPIQNVLNNHKPKRIKNCPLFILVPNGPQPSNSIIPQRLKHWQLLFASLGKIITISINYRPTMRVKDCLNEIMMGVRDKINECRTTFTEGRPIILVGFGHSSLIAAHVALDPTCKVTATICLGFPLAGVNGFRGDLDDPLLDTTVPTLFVIGQNATLSSIDDVEDFRERITKTETGLVVVGGANDHLVVSQTKQRFTGITQAIVDRCISDEIYDFINFVMNPHFIPSENNYVSAAAKNLSKTPTSVKGDKTTKSKSKSKTEKQLVKETTINNQIEKLGIPVADSNSDTSVSNKDSETSSLSTTAVNTESATSVNTPVTKTVPVGIDTSTSCTSGTGVVSDSVPSLDSKKTSTVGLLEGNVSGSKAKPKKSRPKAKKKEEPKRMDETSKLFIGKDDKLDNEEMIPIESKQNKDLKESKESKQGKDKKEGDKESKEGKTIKDTKSCKDTKETKKKEIEPITSIACEPPSTMSTQVSINQPSLPPPLLTAPTLLESTNSTLPISSLSANFTATHTNVTPSPPPPLITAPVSLNEGPGGGNNSGVKPTSTILTSKRKKISTSKFDPDLCQPLKKKREEPLMSVASLEKIERTLDEVIATSVLEFEPPSPSPSIESNSRTPVTQPSSQSDKTISKESMSIHVVHNVPTNTVQFNSSYEVSPVTTLPPSSSNTRTRTIRAPKQLDI